MTHPSHIFGPDDRCARCGYGNWVSGALKPCTAAPVGDRPADTKAPAVDYFEITRGIVG
jgi:hypothetical protein